jgi:anti-sigma regulatory factor (Ser/Thr protein kinase)
MWVLCSYETGELPDVVRDGIWRTHREVVSGGTWSDSSSYDDVNQPLQSDARREPLADPQDIVLADDVGGLREHLVSTMHRHGLPATRVLDMAMATTEIVANALTHGEGVRAIRTGRLGGRYVCDVVDKGPGFYDPLAGYLAPRRGRGSGLWVARQLSWDVGFFHAPEGFTARITA